MDVCDGRTAGQCTLQQIMAQYLSNWQAPGQHLMHGLHMHQALARKGSFCKHVLVNLRAGSAVSVYTTLPRK